MLTKAAIYLIQNSKNWNIVNVLQFKIFFLFSGVLKCKYSAAITPFIQK